MEFQSVTVLENKLMTVEKAVKLMDKNIDIIRQKYYHKNKEKIHHLVIGDLVAIFHEFMWRDIHVEHGNILIDKTIRIHTMGCFVMFFDNMYVSEWHWVKGQHVKKSLEFVHLQKEYNEPTA